MAAAHTSTQAAQVTSAQNAKTDGMDMVRLTMLVARKRRTREMRRRLARLTAAGVTAVMLAGLGQAVAAPQSAQASGTQVMPVLPNVALSDPIPPGELPSPGVPGYTAAAPEWPSGEAVATVPAASSLNSAGALADGDAAATARVKVGGLPVYVSDPAAAGETVAGAPAGSEGGVPGSAPSKVSAQVLDRGLAQTAGRDLLLKVSRADGKYEAGQLTVGIDLSQFRTAYGAGWASRVNLVLLPECALSTPQAPQCRPEPLHTARAGDVVSATIPLTTAASSGELAPSSAPEDEPGEAAATGGQGGAAASRPSAIIAMSSGTSSADGGGDFGATSLSPSATWSAGGNSGGFSWSYGLRVPPSLGGPAPSVSLAYSSQASDGRMATSNTQASWIGEGFDWAPGFIERKYLTCKDDDEGSPNNPGERYDLCWRSDNAMLSLNGRATELLKDASGKWHGRSEDGSRIERKTGAVNGDDDGEYWVVTTTDGTSYYFGLNRLQGWTSGKPVTNSVATAPVFGNHSGEPCHTSAFTDSDCTQAYRWHLDYVVDTHGNTMSLWWGQDSNRYARNNSASDAASYTRDTFLKRIDYGTHQRDLVNSIKTDTVYTAEKAAQQVHFTTGERCFTTCTEDANWLDTPKDLECGAAPCDSYSPAFFSTRRLATVTTKVWDAGSSAHKDVERWTLDHHFPDPGDNGGSWATLWLRHISHEGLVGGQQNVPDVQLDPFMLDNRLDTYGDTLTPMRRPRLAAITTETGGTIGVTYAQPDCSPGSKPTPHTNTTRCYPVRWQPPSEPNPITDWFYKYVVEQVSEQDGTLSGAAASPPVVTTYVYEGGGAWRYAEDDGFVTDDADRTWNQWRGYAKVRTLHGDGADQTRTDTVYFRGMHGDKNTPTGGSRSVQLSDSKGFLSINDEGEYAGMTLEQTVYDAPDGSPLSGSVSKPWRSSPTASRTVGGRTVHARWVKVDETWSWQRLDGGRPDRVTHTKSTFDSLGMTTSVSSDGDAAVSGDESCQLSEYARNSSKNLMALPKRQRSYALTCAQVTAAGGQFTADQIMSEERTSYDGLAYGVVPTAGQVTAVESLKDWQNDTFIGVTTTRMEYDGYGRVVKSWDVDDNLTLTAYTPAADGPVTATTVTTALGWSVSTQIEPAWAAVTRIVDANGHITDVDYDPLGRRTAVWQPGRGKADYPGAPSAQFAYSLSQTAPSVVESTVLGPGGYVTSYELYDGLLRSRQTQTVKANGEPGSMIVDTHYDSAGRAYRTLGPYPVANAPSATFSPHPANDFEEIDMWSKTEYDPAARVVEEIRWHRLAELWRTSTRYPSGDRVEITPPRGGLAVSTIMDAFDRTVELRQHHDGTPASAYDTISYTYDGKGQLSAATNPAGTVWSYEYDLRGHRSVTHDPDKGTSTSAYDDAGRIVSSTDARGVTLHYTYDQIGRRLGLYQGSADPANRLAGWGYDEIAGSKDMLTSSTRYVGGQTGDAFITRTTALSVFGAPASTEIVIPASEAGLAGTYRYDTGFAQDGSPLWTRMPGIGEGTVQLDWETPTVAYNELGLPHKLFSGTDYWVTGAGYYEHGELGILELGQDISSRRLQIGHYYDTATRRLDQTKTTRSVQPYTISDLTYSYDDAGNITAQREASSVAGAQTQCFGYDHRRVLAQAWTPASGDCTTAPDTGALDGPAPYWHSWQVDNAGNRTMFTDHTSGNTTSYAYPAATDPQPHTLTSATTKDSGGTVLDSPVFDYAPTGNTTGRPSAADGQQTLNWDAEGHLESVTDGSGTTTYVYDAEGNRLIRKDPAGKTLYLPGQELRVSADGTSVISCVRYYTFAGKTVAQRDAIGGLSWLAGDHNGNLALTVDAESSAQEVAIRRQDPYGNERGTGSGNWPDNLDKGFVGATHDDTGMIHLGAREYDPVTGRFISVDPVMNLTDPQQMHGYAYANNNPVTFSDPSGLYVFAENQGAGDPGSYTVEERTLWQGGTLSDDLVTIQEVIDTGGLGPEVELSDVDFASWHTGDNLRDLSDWAQNHVLWIVWKHNNPTAAAAIEEAQEEQFKIGLQIVLAACGFIPGGGDLACDGLDAGIAAADGDATGAGLSAGAMIPFVGWGAGGVRLAGLTSDLNKLAEASPNLSRIIKGACSFAADTKILLADGTTQPISETDIGDQVLAADPETGEQGGLKVTHLWVHLDQLVILATTAGTVTTTEDHPFWNETDQQWQRADALDPGDTLLTDDSRLVAVTGITPGSAYTDRAYNLTIAELHTYYVQLSDGTIVLVHNTGGAEACKAGQAGEAAAGIAKNTEKLVINGRKRIPDALNDTLRVIGEVKNVKYQHLSTQLRDYLDFARAKDYRFDLYVNQNTRLSGPLQSLVDSGQVNLIRMKL